MKNPFIQDIKNQYKNGSALIKLIFINVAVFIGIHVLGILMLLFNIKGGAESISYWFSLPASFSQLIVRPWTLFTYMFLHTGLWHLFTNMMWLYFGGQIFNQFLDQKKLVSVYFLGGLAGGLLYIVSFNVFPFFEKIISSSIALGASASVMAVLIAAVAYVPNFKVRLPFIGDVKLKYIGLASILLFIIIGFENNTGGNIAHLGGALFGFIYIQQLKKGNDFTLGFSQFLAYLKAMLSSMFKPKSKMKVVYKKQGKTKTNAAYNEQKVNNQKKVDIILDKISKSGYDSLTADEKAILFDASKK